MRSVIPSALAAALLLGIPGTSGVAQTSGLPAGSYQQTCRNIRNNGSQLNASCQKKDGTWSNTSLDYRNCQGQIENDDGQLRCTDSGGPSTGRQAGGAQAGLPPGDYQQSCRDLRVDKDTLEATCQKKDGSWRSTNLKNVSNCRGQVTNDDGQLRCR